MFWVVLTGVLGKGVLHSDLCRLWSFAPCALLSAPMLSAQDTKAGTTYALVFMFSSHSIDSVLSLK